MYRRALQTVKHGKPVKRTTVDQGEILVLMVLMLLLAEGNAVSDSVVLTLLLFLLM